MNVLQDIGEQAAAVLVLELLKFNDLIKDGGNPALYYAKFGVAWTLADEMVTFFKLGTSHVAQGQYFFIADQVFLNSVVFAVIEKSGIGEFIMDRTSDFTSPFGSQISGSIGTGVVRVGAKALLDVLAPYIINSPMRPLFSITSLLNPQ